VTVFGQLGIFLKQFKQMSRVKKDVGNQLF